MRQIRLLFITFLFLVLSCNSQKKRNISDKELEELFEREKKNEERAKYGGSNSKIEIITNSDELQSLKSYISEKNSERRKKALAESQSKTLPERYKAGDKSVVPLIIKTLKSQDSQAKKEIYLNLSRRYDESDQYQIVEPELIKIILNNISKPEDEKAVIQLSGFMGLKGYPEVFEEQLLLKKSKDKNRLIYWLGKEGKSLKTLEYIEKLIFDDYFDFEENDYVMSGLVGFAKNGTLETKSKAFEIALSIYNQELIPREKFEEMKTSWSSTNPAIGLTEILLESTNKKLIPIAKRFIKNEVREEKALIALIKLEGKTHKELVYKFLRNKDKFFDALQPAAELFKISKSQNLVKTILTEFEGREVHDDYSIERIVSTLVSMDATEYFSELDNIIENKLLVESILKQYDLTKGSIETVANDLYKFGIISDPISNKIIEKAKKLSNTEDSIDYAYDLLSVSNLYLWFDAEPGILPVDYDDLILKFIKNSNGKLNEIDVWMDADVDKSHNINYKIYVSANDRVYIIYPEDIGDWYDVEVVLNLMNTIAKDANLVERYVFIDTGDQTVQTLFGPEDKVNQFIEKYNL
ncbi:hypothetical protein [Hyunsoonleella ulvae]|uniref:hypothetical protein n=1 Tax=Hyunsoonleella ulvae TaxID=2799948 RepID=UPI0019398944|nr:hypothetical protein [Hyunsoonleella ulvae]